MGDHLGDLFWLPFSSTAAYLGMHYLGNLHCISGQIDDNELQEFLLNLES
jgi:hypothetical protein